MSVGGRGYRTCSGSGCGCCGVVDGCVGGGKVISRVLVVVVGGGEEGGVIGCLLVVRG